MFDIREKDFPDIKSTEINGKRYYQTPTGESYPSVTTVLSEMSDKRWLHEWRKKVGEEESKKITARASGRGTRVHSICERYIRNEEDFCSDKSLLAQIMFKSIQPYIDAIDIVYGNEFAAYSHKLKTAGRVDCFCDIGGKPLILDFKTASRQKEEHQIQNYFLQATTYAMMVEELIGMHVPKIAILIAVEEDNPQLFVKNTKDYIEQVREVFSRYHNER